MAQPLLDDALWQVIEPLLPAPKRRRKGIPGAGRWRIERWSAACCSS